MNTSPSPSPLAGPAPAPTSGRPLRRVQVVDSHTGGEPTRIVIGGGPDLGGGTVAEQLRVFRAEHDRFRSAVVNEPRGSDVVVGALLCPPAAAGCVAGVIFFNNVGCLHMCGHGTIGLIATLAHLGRIGPGEHRIETPVGVVTATLHADGCVTVGNVPSRRHATGVSVEVPGLGRVTGDVAWGGNWFYLVAEADHGRSLELARAAELTDFTLRIKRALAAAGITGTDGGEIDHIELFGPAVGEGADSRNFVLCPGGAYDRSPCGTGTSAKLACLAAAGVLAEDEPWVQESVIGSVFTGSYRWLDRAAGTVAPRVTGTAFVNAEATLILDEADPFCWGIR